MPVNDYVFDTPVMTIIGQGNRIMQTHDDMLHHQEFLDRLHERAEKMAKDKQSEITTGKEGEKPLSEWKENGVCCKHMPDDEQGILRISCGGGVDTVPLNYCTIRGSIGKCIDLLEAAVIALRSAR